MANIILLHGAIGAKNQMKSIENELNALQHNVISLNFPGHGDEQECMDDFSIEFFAESVKPHIENLDEVYLLGYSLGGYVSLYLYQFFPEKIKGIMCFGTIFDWSEEQAKKQVSQINPEKLKEKVPAFAEFLRKTHGDKWENVLWNTHKLLNKLGAKKLLDAAYLSSIEVPVIISVGDRDALVSLNESIETYKLLKNASLIVYPSTGHPIEKANAKKIASDFSALFSNQK